jgi:hypothetical protein
MFIENKNISIKIHNLDENIDSDSILNEIKFPLTTENYTYGIFNETKIGKRSLLDFVCLYETTMKTISEKNGEFYVNDNIIKRSSVGKFSILDGKLELFNCDNVIKGILENEFGDGHLSRFIITDENYSEIHDRCFVISSEVYVLKSGQNKYKLNVRSDGLDDANLNKILQNPNFSSISFSGRIIIDKEMTFKLNKNGTIMLYNNQKNPLEWEDIYNFLDRCIY